MTIYYVSSVNGNDTAAGTSQSDPLATLQAAADKTQPGDTVIVGSGTYTAQANGSALTITTSGTANAPITYEAAPGAHPVIDVPAAAWAGIFEYASYVVISGFEVAGNAQNVTLAYAQSQENNLDNPTTSADGIDVGYVGDTTVPQHVTIENNVVHDMPGGGVVSTYSDYVTIQGNTVYGNAHYSPFGNSGITLGFSQDVDSNTGIKNFVIGNTAYGNQQLVPTTGFGTITDGEGIIIDDNSNDQTNGKQYIGGTLVENNLTYLNGGPGIEAYDSSNVSILYNTTYQDGSSDVNPSEIFVNNAKNTTVENNILSAGAGGQTGGNVDSTNTIWDYNLLYGGTSGITGSHDKTGNPLFINPGAGNFQISSGSPAIGAANKSFIDATDIEGNPRPAGQMDMGAYQDIPSTTPAPVSSPPPVASPNGTIITSPSSPPIIDTSGNRWTLVSSATNGLQIAVNGTVDAVTANVVLLEQLSGKIEQENTSGNWYVEPGPQGPWTQIAAPSVKVTSSAGGKSTTVSAANTGTIVARSDTFALTEPGVAKVTLGLISNTLRFSGLSSVSLTGGRAATTVIDDGGVNTFTAGSADLVVTGGAGSDSYIYHQSNGLMTVNDFSSAKGDTLTVDKALQGTMVLQSDGHGGELFSFGAGNPGVDLVGNTSVTAAQVHFA